ncbi:hypothetical protein SAMN05421784_1259 [Xenorhabdus koppenhoeferi]|uniref:Uncharacterized protein n=1 Tax=Xenorhabdus koppenhoeferi TaxID=351659 RepID=A0A1I7IYF8_9GAMM|nr:hypothetical protein SAMN05421784_1259 [Xenorhabdus koppenhoeferi]
MTQPMINTTSNNFDDESIYSIDYDLIDILKKKLQNTLNTMQ